MFEAHYKCLPFSFVDLKTKMFTNIKVHASNCTCWKDGFFTCQKNFFGQKKLKFESNWIERGVCITFAFEKYTGLLEYMRFWFVSIYPRTHESLQRSSSRGLCAIKLSACALQFILNHTCSSKMFCLINNRPKNAFSHSIHMANSFSSARSSSP